MLARVSLALGHVATARELLADASRLARRTAGCRRLRTLVHRRVGRVRRTSRERAGGRRVADDRPSCGSCGSCRPTTRSRRSRSGSTSPRTPSRLTSTRCIASSTPPPVPKRSPTPPAPACSVPDSTRAGVSAAGRAPEHGSVSRRPSPRPRCRSRSPAPDGVLRPPPARTRRSRPVVTSTSTISSSRPRRVRELDRPAQRGGACPRRQQRRHVNKSAGLRRRGSSGRSRGGSACMCGERPPAPIAAGPRRRPPGRAAVARLRLGGCRPSPSPASPPVANLTSP